MPGTHIPSNGHAKYLSRCHRAMNSDVNLPAKAMLLAAGKGTRLRPLTNQVPKCMVPVGGKPILEWNIHWLRRYGITDLVMNLHYKPEAVIDYFGDGNEWGVNITYSYEQELLGTAGGVKNVEFFFDDGPFLLWYGDNMSTCELDKLFELHRRKEAFATMALYYRSDPTSSGIVGLDDSEQVTNFLEKPSWDQVFSNWVSAGIFIMERDVLDHIPATGASDFGHDILPALLEEGLPLFGYRMTPTEGLWWIDKPDDLQRVQHEYSQNNEKGKAV